MGLFSSSKSKTSNTTNNDIDINRSQVASNVGQTNVVGKQGTINQTNITNELDGGAVRSALSSNTDIAATAFESNESTVNKAFEFSNSVANKAFQSAESFGAKTRESFEDSLAFVDSGLSSLLDFASDDREQSFKSTQMAFGAINSNLNTALDFALGAQEKNSFDAGATKQLALIVGGSMVLIAAFAFMGKG